MKHKKLIWIFVFILVLNSFNVFSIAIGPAEHKLFFEPNLEKRLHIDIINKEKKNMELDISAKGELAQYITLEQDKIKITSEEGKKRIYFTIKLPQSFEKPGLHEGEITLTKAKEKLKNGVSATVAIASRVLVDVPYPGRYAEAKVFTSQQPEKTDKVVITVPVMNYGSEEIKEAYAEINIFDLNNNKIKTIETDKKSIRPKKEAVLEAKTELEQGEYYLIIDLFYDGNKIELNKNFLVEGNYLKLIYTNIDEFNLGEIARIELKVKNTWNKELKNVLGNIIIKDKDKIIAELKTTTKDIAKDQEIIYEAFWETNANVEEKVYDLKITFSNEAELLEKTVKLDLTGKIKQTEIIEKTENSYYGLILIAILLVAILSWFTYSRLKNR